MFGPLGQLRMQHVVQICNHQVREQLDFIVSTSYVKVRRLQQHNLWVGPLC